MTKDELISFEKAIADEYNEKKIPFPVHLDNGNEEALIELFRHVKPQDWIFGSWRLHYKALLKGVPKEELRAAIYRGESMALRFDDFRVYGSAIAGGIIPIALGTALAIKKSHAIEHVWLFVGDMMAESGILHEALKYASNFSLPFTVVVEDNGVSVCTDTKEAWGINAHHRFEAKNAEIIRYDYRSKYPHCGSGTRLQF